MRLPSIIRMLYYIRRPMQKVALTKKNILLRDDYTCQYCNLKGERLMTVDHVLPRSKGGPSTWENLVMRVHCVATIARTTVRPNMRTCRCAASPKRRSIFRGSASNVIRCPANGTKFLFLYNVSIDERLE